MSNKMYEVRTFKHELDEADRNQTPEELIKPLEEICINHGGRPNHLANRSDESRAVRSYAIAYVIDNTAGGMVQVDLGVSKADKGLRQVKIIKPYHGGESISLRMALHRFFSGKEGYGALPVPQKESYGIKV